MRLGGDIALVTGRAAIEAEINGQPRSLRLVFLNARTKTPKGWKFIAWQSTPQPTTSNDVGASSSSAQGRHRGWRAARPAAGLYGL